MVTAFRECVILNQQNNKMEKLIHFNTVRDYNDFNNHETLHPLVSIVDLSKADPRAGHKMLFQIFCVVLKKVKCGNLRYGNNYYDYQGI